jgi:uncharacterized protein HemX
MKPQANSQESKDSLIEAEIQHNIPVKQHSLDGLKNPITAIKQFAEHDNKGDKDLDHVLADVNKSVKDAEKKAPKKSFFSVHNKNAAGKPVSSNKKVEPVKEAKKTKPLLAAGIAAFVAITLSAAAIYAFSQQKTSPTKKSLISSKAASPSSSQTASSDKMSPDDLSKLSSELNSKVDSLNDSQDFNATDLSDANLGL